MATQDGAVNYQTYAQPMMAARPGPTTASTKVMNLSRAQAPQPGSGGGQPTYYAQPTAQPQVASYPTQYQQSAVQDYTTSAPRYNAQQPQVYTVGSSQTFSGQQPQQPQPYRVSATPGQQQQGTMAYGAAEGTPSPTYATQSPQTYYAQPAATQMQTRTYQQPQQQTYQAYPQQQTQPYGQVVYAQPSRQVQPAMPASYQTQASAGSQFSQTTGAYTAYPASNQQQSPGQPMSAQPAQAWVSTQNQPSYDQGYQQPRQFSNVTAQQVGPTSPPLQPSPVKQYSQQVTQPQANLSASYQLAQQNLPIQQAAYEPVQFKPQQAPQSPQGVPTPVYQARPPVKPSQQQQVRQRIPSAGGPSRTIKVRSLPMRTASMDGVDATGPPQFVQHPTSQVHVNEGEPTHLSAVVRPAGDSSLHVEWFKNGKPLAASSRFTTSFDRGYAILDFLYTNEDDTGDYSCVATNKEGQDQSSACHITVIPEEKVVTDTQLPEESMVANLAAFENQMMQNGSIGDRYPDESRSTRPPQFVRALAPQTGIKEGAPAHFETVVEPANDATLTIEWYKDGKPVAMGCRFNSVLDRGYAILDILYCYPDDNGSYWCIAKNALGQVQSNVVDLQCNAEANIVTSSVLSKESVSYLQSLDNWHSDQMSGYDSVHVEEEEARCAPSFDILPVALTVVEGDPARFMVKAGGYPRPKVMWYINGDLLASSGAGGNWRIYQDGGISHLEFHRAGPPCQMNIRAVARNELGEAAADTVLVVEPQEDYRPDLRHVQLENPFKKLSQLKRVERSPELNSAFGRARPRALDLRRIERDQEHRARTAADAETIETENLYARVQAGLRTSRRSSLPPPARPQQPGVQQAPRAPQAPRQPPLPPSQPQVRQAQPAQMQAQQQMHQTQIQMQVQGQPQQLQQQQFQVKLQQQPVPQQNQPRPPPPPQPAPQPRMQMQVQQPQIRMQAQPVPAPAPTAPPPPPQQQAQVVQLQPQHVPPPPPPPPPPAPQPQTRVQQEAPPPPQAVATAVVEQPLPAGLQTVPPVQQQ
ncbi:unnamed protein product [Calicophoron daubneyi]|uniref:Ig-like domain-containing protein n=1 Tax=Calicophoron daubneyi TaxID=300641 RepID=A0AAV2TT60_CALDB